MTLLSHQDWQHLSFGPLSYPHNTIVTDHNTEIKVWYNFINTNYKSLTWTDLPMVVTCNRRLVFWLTDPLLDQYWNHIIINTFSTSSVDLYINFQHIVLALSLGLIWTRSDEFWALHIYGHTLVSHRPVPDTVTD